MITKLRVKWGTEFTPADDGSRFMEIHDREGNRSGPVINKNVTSAFLHVFFVNSTAF